MKAWEREGFTNEAEYAKAMLKTLRQDKFFWLRQKQGAPDRDKALARITGAEKRLKAAGYR